MKFNVLITETIVILGALIFAGCIAAVVFRPESSTPIIVIVTTVVGLAVSTVLQLRGIKANGDKLDRVSEQATVAVKQTNGINSNLLANLQVLLKHVSGDQPLTTAEVEVVRDKIAGATLQIDKEKGIK